MLKLKTLPKRELATTVMSVPSIPTLPSQPSPPRVTSPKVLEEIPEISVAAPVGPPKKVVLRKPLNLAVLESSKKASAKLLSTPPEEISAPVVKKGRKVLAPIAAASTERLGPSASDYKRYDIREHVYKKPDTYIGGDKPLEYTDYVYDFENQQMKNTPLNYVPGCERLYLEILSNATDNSSRSRRKNVNPGHIEITMTKSTISILNYGLPIPIEMHPTEHMYVPTLIFGHPFASSNFEVERLDAGTNGLGAKVVNIFSLVFTVVVCDHYSKQRFSQTWRNNMQDVEPEEVTPYTGKVSSVQITYQMDFERFGYPVPTETEGGYPPEVFELYARHAADASFTAKIPVRFNGIQFNNPTLRDHARLYFGEVVDTGIVHYEWPKNTEIVRKKNGHQDARAEGILPDIEMIILDTPDAGPNSQVSFANGLVTRDGGVHVQAAYRAISAVVVQSINENVIKRLTRENKGRELTPHEKRAYTVNVEDLKPHMTMILSVRVVNPSHNSQTKVFLNGPTPRFHITENDVKGIDRWRLIDRLYAALEAKQFSISSKKGGKLKRYLRLKKGIDANNAGKAMRHKCELYITEGNSAMGYAEKLMKYVEGDRDFVGLLPMRGKGLNVMNASTMQVEKNKEIAELVRMVGLRPGCDYTDPANFNHLRYGSIMIMADPDVDGKHIIGLILNFFFCRHPSLLQRGFIKFYRAPILRVKHRNTVLKFYNLREYESWKEMTPNFMKWEHMYFKGLGTSEDKEIEDDYRTARIVTCAFDSQTSHAMNIAFNKTLADQRKEWIRVWSPEIGADEMEVQPISTFIDQELILYSIANIIRAIPKLMDGFKDVTRKIIHGAHLKWKIGSKKPYSQYKIAQFAGFLASNSCYQHGEVNLDDVIVGLIQDFIGSNNITWFYKKGIFGTRYHGGHDAAQTRYTHTYPEALFPYILRKEDRPILVHKIDEGTKIEPETYHPIIPMLLANGSLGIGTAYSTFIPAHNPLDLIQWIRCKLQGRPDEDLPNLIPWYRGFTGIIHVFDRSQRKRRPNVVRVTTITNVNDVPVVTTSEQNEADVDDNPANEALNIEEDEAEVYIDTDITGRPLMSFVSLGTYYQEVTGRIIVTEMPIGRWPIKYRKWLEEMVEDKIITGYVDKSVDDRIYFEIEGFPEPINHRTLRLKRTMGMSNMYVLDENDKPIRYDTAQDLIEAFYVRRLPIYATRKNYEIDTITREIENLSELARFIRAVVEEDLIVFKRPVQDIYADMDQMNFSRELLKTTALHRCTREKIEEIMQTIQSKMETREVIAATPIETLWLRDLDELETKYVSIYGRNVQNNQMPAPRIELSNSMFTGYTPPKRRGRRLRIAAQSSAPSGDVAPVNP